MTGADLTLHIFFLKNTVNMTKAVFINLTTT
jgi:hypothetical protein